ncbi:MAG TPA: nucleotide disphospho-sugar-binding domain-containing protein, partial [Candidatus Limnocylindria bacterium]|nr:nucleotide disphospho-sugar-binding domain-containing protein [Candidatus Limnocylindria bacterium]
ANRFLWGMLDRMLQRTAKPLDDLLQRAGSSQRGVALFRARSPLLHLVACSPAIMRVPPDLPPTTHVTGAWLDRSAPPALPAELEAFLADGGPPIVVTFGSMAGAPDGEVAAAIRAMLDGGRRVVVQGVETETSPSLLRIGAVDHRAIFPRASLVVHHGGAGTTHAAVAAGVPSVVVPHVGDQRYWADRLHRLGAAPAPVAVRNLSGAALADASLASASDPRMREAARALATRLAHEDGVSTAVSLLERVAS